MKFTCVVLICGFLGMPALCCAQGFSLGYDNWNYRVSGIIDEDGTTLRLHRNLGVRPVSRDTYLASWDTGPGWWPDLEAHYMSVRLTGNNPYTTSNGVQVGPVQALPPTTTTLQSSTDINDADLTMSYPLQLGPVRASGGIMVKFLGGHIQLSDSAGDQGDQRIRELFPLAHLQFDLPLGRFFNLRASANAIADQGDNASEFMVAAQFRLLGPLTVNAGWQRKHYRVDESDYLLDTTLQGVLLGAHLVFN